MKSYILKPVSVKAELFNPDRIKEYREMWAKIEMTNNQRDIVYMLKTLESYTFIREWDYIVIWTKWEFYPCKKDIFESKYIEEK